MGFSKIMRGFTLPSQFPPVHQPGFDSRFKSSEEIGRVVPLLPIPSRYHDTGAVPMLSSGFSSGEFASQGKPQPSIPTCLVSASGHLWWCIAWLCLLVPSYARYRATGTVVSPIQARLFSAPLSVQGKKYYLAGSPQGICIFFFFFCCQISSSRQIIRYVHVSLSSATGYQ